MSDEKVAGMQVYAEEDELIEGWQWNSPPLRNLDDLVVALLHGERGRVLDLGCGSGRLSAALARRGFTVDGIDVERRAIKIGQRILARRGLTNVRLYAGDVFDPAHPVGAGGYDVLVCADVLEHVGPWRELLARGGELLRPGGLLALTVPRDPGQFTPLDSYSGHLRRFRDEELLGELRQDYEALIVRQPGFPTMRAIVWVYARLLALCGQTYAVQARTLWRAPGFFQRLAIPLNYRLLKFDNLFAGLRFGTHLVVRGRKRRTPPAA